MKNLSDLSTNNYIQISNALQDSDIWAVNYTPAKNDEPCKHAAEVVYLQEELELLQNAYLDQKDENQRLLKCIQFYGQRTK